MKPILKIGFTDYFNPVPEFFTDVLKEDFIIIRDDINPEYLFFCDENFGTINRQDNYIHGPKKRIFYTGENRRPWNYHSHHAITFDHMEGYHFYRLPLYVLENWVNQKKLGWGDIREFKRTMTAENKEGFCSMVVRNPGCAERNAIFHKLSAYKQVASGGPLFNNIGGPIDQDGFNSHVTKTNFLKKYKFHIAYENSSYPGYVTEKILHGFLGESIPIYWGSPCVEMDFDTGSFINRHDYLSDEDMIEHIIYIDSNDDVYNRMMKKHILNNNKFLSLERFRHWFRTEVFVQ